MTDADFILDPSQWSGLPMWAQVTLLIMLVIRVVVIITPTQVDNAFMGKWINPLLLFINRWLAGNVGYARNADDPGAGQVLDAVAEKKAAAFVQFMDTMKESKAGEAGAGYQPADSDNLGTPPGAK